MRKIGITVALVICSLVVARRAHAAPYDFSAGSWIIPMDSCFQGSQSFNGSTFNGRTEASTVYGGHGSCPNTSSGTDKDGILKAYGFIYRLLGYNIPVYYILNPNKTTIDDVDLTLTGTNVVKLVNHAGGASTNFLTTTTATYRGAPFIISAADVPAAKALLTGNAQFTQIDSRTGRGIFQDVNIHEAQANILQAPVRAILLQNPPKIALLNIGNAAIGVLIGYLQDSGLYDAAAVARYPTIGSIFTEFTQPTDFTTSNGLVADNFQILWSPHWKADDTSLISAADRDAVTAKISAFLDAGHPVLAQCASIAALEGAHANDGNDETGDVNGHFITTVAGATKGVLSNQLTSPFPNTGSAAIVVNPNATLKAWLDPLTQTGDFPLRLTSGGFTFDFSPNTAVGSAYKPFVNSYVQSANTGRASTNGLQFESVAYKDGDPKKGLIIYLGGHSYGSKFDPCSGGVCTPTNQYNMLGLERLVLNTLIFLGQVPSQKEQTRSAPIVAPDGKVYLGTYVQQTSAQAAFPPWTGHFREYAPGSLAGTNVAAFNSVVPDWDSYNAVKVQAASDSRTIYTAVPQSGKLTQFPFTTANLAKVQVTVPTATTNQITQIRQGLLGGVDHSIPAIIPPSKVAGLATRPTVAYFGGLDGMIHAIQVSTNGQSTGKNNGDELWAFIPPSQLLKTFQQSGGVDGSPNVGDAFIDTTGTGNSHSWHTLLAVPDGNYANGTLDVIDITDPLNPKFLWEASDTTTIASKTYVLGRAQGAAISPVMTTSGVKYAYFIATDNTNGTAGNAFNMYALNAEDGSVIWRYNHLYANDTTHNDVPGSVAIIDDVGDGGPVNRVYFGDLEGKVWKVNAVDGSSPTVVFDAAVTYSPSNSVNYPIESGIVLYRDPTNFHLTALGVTSGADWVPAATLSRVFKIDLPTTGAPVATTLATLGVGERVYAVPTVKDNAAYFITSIGSLQSAIGTAFTASGNLMRVSIGSTPSVTTLATVKQGASEVAVDANGNVIAASATGITANSNSGVDKSQGTQQLQNQASSPISVRAWLDLH